MDTGIFTENRYFDVFVEYAKAASEDIAHPHHRLQPRPGSRAACTFCPPYGFAIAGTGAIPTTFAELSRIDGPVGRIAFPGSRFPLRKALAAF